MATSVASSNQSRNVRQLKQDQELINPCYKESNLSAQCLENNQYDYTQCQAQFDNYKLCKRFWSAVMSTRRQAGISPIVPPPDERERIKREHFKTWNP